MKKTLLLSALVASVASFAGTTGFVEAYNDNTTPFLKDVKLTDSIKETKSTFGIKGEVKVEGSGFSAGGDLKVKDYPIFNGKEGFAIFKTALKRKSNVWAKYELPQLKGVDTYIKGTYKVEGEIELEANAKYKKDDLTVELNSKTSLPLGTPKIVYEAADKTNADEAIRNSKKHEVQHSYLEKVVSTHKLSVEKEKLSVISDLKASVEVQHAYAAELVAKKTDKDKQGNYNEFLKEGEKGTYNSAFKYVKAEVSGTYKEVKDLEVKAELGVAYNPYSNKGFRLDGAYTDDVLEVKFGPLFRGLQKAIKDKETFGKFISLNEDTLKTVNVGNAKKTITEFTGKYKNIVLGLGLPGYSNSKFGFTGKFSDKLFVEAKYTGVKDLEVTGGVKLAHSVDTVKIETTDVNEHNVLLDVKAGAKYTGIANTTLTGSLDFLLLSNDNKMKIANNIENYRLNVISLVADLGAKYDYKATDKLTISPELNAKGILIKPLFAPITFLGLVVSPKVSAEYKATDKLTIKGTVETPISFGSVMGKSSYIGTTVKTNFNVKYAW